MLRRNISGCHGSLILSFTCNFFAYFKFRRDWGRVIGKIKQNELDCRDTAPLTPVLLYLLNVEINVSLMYSKYREAPAINLFLFFTWKAEFSNNFLFHVLIDVRIVFFKKNCASKVLRDGYGNLIRPGEPQVSVTWADLIFWSGKTKTKCKSF